MSTLNSTNNPGFPRASSREATLHLPSRDSSNSNNNNSKVRCPSNRLKASSKDKSHSKHSFKALLLSNNSKEHHLNNSSKAGPLLPSNSSKGPLLQLNNNSSRGLHHHSNSSSREEPPHHHHSNNNNHVRGDRGELSRIRRRSLLRRNT